MNPHKKITMNNTPIISIIVPVYNAGMYLRRCLDSIAAQIEKNFECILVDDGSTDESGVILDEYAKRDDRFIVFHKTNGGVSSARNLGLSKAKGKWITFCDSDDYVACNWLESMFNLGSTESAQVVVCDFYEMSLKGNERKYAWDFSGDHPYMTLNSHERDLDQAIRYSWGVVWNLLIDASFLQTYHIQFDDGITFSEDSVFFIKLIAYGIKVSYLNKPLYYYNRTNESAVTHQLQKKNLVDRILAFNLLSKTLNELGLFKATRNAMSDRLFSFCIGLASDKSYHNIIIDAMCPDYNSRIFKSQGGNLKAKILLWLLTHKMRPIAEGIINLRTLYDGQ